MTSLFRALIFMALIVGAVVLIQHSVSEPGSVVFVWYGYQIETSMTVLVALFNIALIMAFYGGRFMGFVFDIPQRIKQFAQRRQDQRALALMAEGVSAITAGDTKQQAKLADQLTKALPHEDLALTLTAHLNPTPERLHLLLANPETVFMGHVGLLDLAMERQDWAGVKFHAEAALKKRPNSPKVQRHLFEAHVHTCQFEDALPLLLKLKRTQQLGETTPVLEAAIHLHMGITQKAENPTSALRQAVSAQKVCPQFVPAALFRASTLMSLGKSAPAERALSEFWHTCPRFDVYQKWWQIVKDANPDLPADKMMKKVEQLVDAKLSHPDEGAIAALCAGDAALQLEYPEKARSYFMQAFRQSATKTVLRRLALLEQRLGDEAAAADWLTQAMEAPEMEQPGDRVLAAYQDFRHKYGLESKTSAHNIGPQSKVPSHLMLAG